MTQTKTDETTYARQETHSAPVTNPEITTIVGPPYKLVNHFAPRHLELVSEAANANRYNSPRPHGRPSFPY